MRVRVTLCVGGLLAVVAALNYVMVESVAPDYAVRTLGLGLAAAVAATVLTLWLTARYETGIQRIAAGLAEVARGRRDLRFDVSREPLTAHLARSANEALMALADNADPAVGPVRVRKRKDTPPPRPVVLSEDDDPSVGTPRVMAAPAPKSKVTPLPPSPALPSTPPPVVADGPALAPARASPPAPASLPPLPAVESIPATPSASTPDDASTLPPPRHASSIPVMAASVPDPSNPGGPNPTPVPTDPGLRAQQVAALYEEYRTALDSTGESTEDLTLEAFAETLEASEQDLVRTHACRSVRFSVLVDGGRVQLLPRLVR
jgi:hypothetical protein